MKIFLYVVALILIAFGAAVSVMSLLAPGDVLVGVTPALGASLLVGGLLLLGLGVIVGGLQELNANIVHLLYLVTEQQSAFAAPVEAIDDMEQTAPYEEPLVESPAAPPADAAMAVPEPPVVTQAPEAAGAPSPGHMAAAAAAAMAAQGASGEVAAKADSAGMAPETEIERIPVVPVPETEREGAGGPSAKPAAGDAMLSPEAADSKVERSSVKHAAAKENVPETKTGATAAGKPGAEVPSASAVLKKEAGRVESGGHGTRKKKDVGKSAVEEPPSAIAGEEKEGKTASAPAAPAGKPAEGPAQAVKKDEPAAKPAGEKKEPVAPAAEKGKPDGAGEKAESGAKEPPADLDGGASKDRLTGAAAAAARAAAGKGQSAAEKIAARLEALKKESVFTEKKKGGAPAAAADEGEESPLEKVLEKAEDQRGGGAIAVEEGEAPAGEDLLYVVEQRVIRGRPARILSDGTIEAEMDEGWLRFENRAHLDEYLDALEAEK